MTLSGEYHFAIEKIESAMLALNQQNKADTDLKTKIYLNNGADALLVRLGDIKAEAFNLGVLEYYFPNTGLTARSLRNIREQEGRGLNEIHREKVRNCIQKDLSRISHECRGAVTRNDAKLIGLCTQRLALIQLYILTESY